MMIGRFVEGRRRRDAERRKRSLWIREFARRAQTNPHYAADWVASRVAMALPAGARIAHRVKLEAPNVGAFDLISADGRRVYFASRADVSTYRPIVESSFLAWNGARMVEREVPSADEGGWPIGPGDSAIVERAATLEAWDPIASRLNLADLAVLTRVSRGLRDLVQGSAAVASRVPVEWRGHAGHSIFRLATLFAPWERPGVRFDRVPNDQDLMRAAFMHWFSRSRRFRDRDLQLRILVAPMTTAVPVLRICVGGGSWFEMRMRTKRAKFFDLRLSITSHAGRKLVMPVFMRLLECE